LTLKWARETGTPLVQALAKVTSASARVLAEDTGSLAVGAKADIVIFSEAEPWRVDASSIVSAGKNSPYFGYELEGRARMTIVGGEVRFERI
ncbi:MAG: amidohydrolase family protein, partial [Burkholderiaceae bacterium]